MLYLRVSKFNECQGALLEGLPWLLWASNSQALEPHERSQVSFPSRHQPQKICLHQNLFQGAFSSAEIAPPENAFFHVLPTMLVNRLPEFIGAKPCQHIPCHNWSLLAGMVLVPMQATCCCICPSSKSVCSCHWSCSCPFRGGTVSPGCSPEPGHTSDQPLTDTDPHSALTL